MPLLNFAAEVRPTEHPDYYYCTYLKTQVQVIITTRVKTMIDQGEWQHCLPEDREEIRNLRELGFLIESNEPFLATQVLSTCLTDNLPDA